MRHTIHARALALSDEDIATVHARLFEHLHSFSKMCSYGVIPPAPRITGGNSTAIGSLKGFLPKGMKGHVVYMFRRDAEITSWSGDDWIQIEFRPSDQLCRDIVDDFVPHLIQAMNPYMVAVGDEKFDKPVISPEGTIKVGGPRACGCKLHPVFYLAEWRLKQLYKTTIEEAVRVLRPLVQRISIIEDGIYVAAAEGLVSFEEAREKVIQIEKSLEAAKPGLARFFRNLLKRN